MVTMRNLRPVGGECWELAGSTLRIQTAVAVAHGGVLFVTGCHKRSPGGYPAFPEKV